MRISWKLEKYGDCEVESSSNICDITKLHPQRVAWEMLQHKELLNKHLNAVHGLEVDQKRKRNSEDQIENKRDKKENSLHQIFSH